MEKLQEKDPEFYKFLKENDKELLEFNDSDTGSEIEGSNDDDEGDMDEDYDEENEEDSDDDDDKGRSEVGKLCGVIVTLFVNDFPSSKA